MRRPGWSEDDRQAALAWQAEQALKCPGCGHWLDETTSEDGSDWEPHVVRCRACEARDLRREDDQREFQGRGTAGLLYTAREVTRG